MARLNNKRSVFIVVVAMLCVRSIAAQELAIAADHADGVYKAGETVRWSVKNPSTTQPTSLSYTIKKGALTDVGHGTLDIKGGEWSVASTFDQPGTLLLEVNAQSDGDKKQRSLGGAICEPDKIKPSSTPPQDFDEFWRAKIDELKAVPANPVLTQGESNKDGVSYWKITLDNIRSRHIQGQLARPAKGERFPAMFIPQWAGVYGLQKSWVTDRAAEGWLALNIEAHDIPIDQPESFYKEQAAGALKNYWEIGNDDRDTSYFLPMYLSCYRAIDYLSHRPDWDGNVLVVIGTSQGGQQTLMTAGLCTGADSPGVTGAIAAVPAGGDMLGPDVGRLGGFPQWYWKTENKDAQKVRQASCYFEIANFASRIKCPTLVATGLIDETCPAAGVCAAFNQITSPKELVLMPTATHQMIDPSPAHYNERRNAWLGALRQEKVPTE